MEWFKKMSSYTPLLAAALVAACVGSSLSGYVAPVYETELEVLAADTEENQEAAADESKNTDTNAAKGSFDLEDGTYTGTGTGYAGQITVAVTIKDHSITAIEITNVEADDEAFFNRAKGVIEKIIAAQSLDVDVVSGATYSSRGIISAVKNALTGEADTNVTAASSGTASGSSSPAGGSTTVATVEDAKAYKDGTYYGTGTGFAGSLTVMVTISDGNIASINITDTVDGSSYIAKASALIEKIIASQSTNVDTISGATYSSVGIIEAVRNALSQASVTTSGENGNTTAGGNQNTNQNTNQNSNQTGNKDTSTGGNKNTSVTGKFPYTEGVYYGTAEGYIDDITVAVVIQDQTIKSILITKTEDDEAFMNRAKSVAEKVVETQSTKVDLVSGATYSSRGILNAIKAALKEAKKATTGTTDKNTGNNSSNNSGNSGNNSSNNSGNNSSNNSNGGNSSNSGNNSGSNSGNSGNNTGNSDNNTTDNTGGNTDDKESGDNTGNSNGNEDQNGDSETSTKPVRKTYSVTVACNPDAYEDFDTYNMTMDITVEDGKIVAIENVAGDGDSSNASYIKRAANGTSSKKGVVTQVLASGTYQNVDTVSRATCSSKSIIEACKYALEMYAEK